ncbi:MAG: glycosyltransferase family 4 protein [Flavobacteriaceae bacterium]|nr:glycosyltransferase family 4 protein [Flavobacteriaceae bacterium]
MKKILYIGNRLKHDKVTITSVDTLGMFLKKEGFEVRIASGIKNKFLRLIDMCRAVFKYKKETDIVLIDTYSTTNFYYAVAVAWCCKRVNIPYIPILRGGNLPHRLLSDKKKSDFLFKGAKINVSPSLYLEQAFIQSGYKKVVCIPNSIEIRKYQFSQRPVKPHLLWVRSFAKIYNPLLALQVFEKLRQDFPDATLCMVGPEKDGSLAICKKYANDHNLPVEFTGKLSKQEWIEHSKDSSVFINTTNFDNTPVSVIEAMALGLPVVSTNVGGISYLLDDGSDALLVEPNSVDAFLKALNDLFRNPQRASSLTENARKKAESFDWEKVKYQWFDILK